MMSHRKSVSLCALAVGGSRCVFVRLGGASGYILVGLGFGNCLREP